MGPHHICCALWHCVIGRRRPAALPDGAVSGRRRYPIASWAQHPGLRLALVLAGAVTAGLAGAAEQPAPLIEILEPARSYGKDLRVEATGTRVRVVGLARGAAEIVRVTINGQPAALETAAAKDLALVGGAGGKGVRFTGHAVVPDQGGAIAVEAVDAAGGRARRQILVQPAARSDAGAPAGAGTRWAVVIGVRDYEAPGIHDLRFCDKDARALYDALTDPDRGAVPAAQARLLCDGMEARPSRKETLQALAWLRARAKPEDTVLISFSGHGFMDHLGAYLLPCDTDPEALAATGIRTEEFNQFVDAIPARKKLIFLDACHSGGVVKAKDLGIKPNEHTLPMDYYQKLHARSEGRITFTSCKANEVSWESEKDRHGVFTLALLEAIRGAADADKNGVITFDETKGYVVRRVAEVAAERGRDQTPQVETIAHTGEFLLARNSGVVQDDRFRQRRRQILQSGLAPEEQRFALAIVERERTGALLDERERQALPFLLDLLNAKIDLATYRRGVAAAAAAPAGEMRMAVLPFQNLVADPNFRQMGEWMAEVVTTEFGQVKGIQLVERAQIDRVLGEMKLQQNALFDPDSVAAVGKQLGVPFVVIGSCMKAGDVINLTARRVEVATSRILETATTRASADPEKVFDDLPKVAQRLREAMGSGR